MLYLYAGYLLVMNLVCFFMMLADKRFAQRHQWRIRERTLFGLALLGGALGGYLGMHLFHHKTKHLLFAVGLPLAVMLHILIAYLLFHYGIIML